MVPSFRSEYKIRLDKWILAEENCDVRVPRMINVYDKHSGHVSIKNALILLYMNCARKENGHSKTTAEQTL